MRLIEFLKETEDVYQTYDLVGDRVSGLPSRKSMQLHKWDIDDAIEDITFELHKKGFEKLGRGAFSHVYGKPDLDYVIKVSSSMTLDCTKAYLKLGRYGNANKHIPRVYKFKVFKTPKGQRTFMVSAVERLYEFNPEEIKLTKDERYNAGFISFIAIKFELKSITDLVYNNRIIRQRANDVGLFPLSNRASKTELSNRFLDDVGTWLFEVFYPLERRWLEKYSHTPFVRAYEIVKDLRDSYDTCGLDLYQRNFMMRKDGTLVFSDPVYG